MTMSDVAIIADELARHADNLTAARYAIERANGKTPLTAAYEAQQTTRAMLSVALENALDRATIAAYVRASDDQPDALCPHARPSCSPIDFADSGRTPRGWDTTT